MEKPDGRRVADLLYGRDEPTERRAPEPEVPPPFEHKRILDVEIKRGSIKWEPEVTRTGRVQRIESGGGPPNRR